MPYLFLLFCLLVLGTSSASHGAGWDQQKMVLANVSLKTGVDVVELASMAALESSFNATAKASTSTAKGLFQFTERTWRVTLETYGSRYSLLPTVSRLDPYANSLMGAEYIKENRRILTKRLNREVTFTDVYMAHVIAPRRVVALDHIPQYVLIAELYPTLAIANKSLFYNEDGKSKTIAEFKLKFKEKVLGAVNQYYHVATTAVNELRSKRAVARFDQLLNLPSRRLCHNGEVETASLIQTALLQWPANTQCVFITSKKPPSNQLYSSVGITTDRRRIV